MIPWLSPRIDSYPQGVISGSWVRAPHRANFFSSFSCDAMYYLKYIKLSNFVFCQEGTLEQPWLLLSVQLTSIMRRHSAPWGQYVVMDIHHRNLIVNFLYLLYHTDSDLQICRQSKTDCLQSCCQWGPQCKGTYNQAHTCTPSHHTHPHCHTMHPLTPHTHTHTLLHHCSWSVS